MGVSAMRSQHHPIPTTSRRPLEAFFAIAEVPGYFCFLAQMGNSNLKHGQRRLGLRNIVSSGGFRGVAAGDFRLWSHLAAYSIPHSRASRDCPSSFIGEVTLQIYGMVEV